MNQQSSSISRRGFVASAAAAAIGVSATASAKSTGGKFKLKYAPNLGTFNAHAGKDPIDNLKFMAEEGFEAMFDNGFPNKDKALQDKIAKQMDTLSMTMGPFVLYADFSVKTFVTRDKEVREMLINKMKEGVEIRKRTGAKWALVVPGKYDDKLEWSYQTANVIENLKYCAEVVEESGLVLVLEPLNAHTNHPGLFLTKIPQAYQICRAVDSPSVKIVNDLYHQQITEGNLIPNIDMAWSEIATFHIGDNPGRKEPGTGEINYKNIFKHLYKKGYKGTLCAEHGRSIKGKDGERALIDAYRAADDFEV